MSEQQRSPLRIVGAAFHSAQGKSYLASGHVTINGLRQRFFLFRNDRKAGGSNEPDFYLKASEGPERDASGTPTVHEDGDRR